MNEIAIVCVDDNPAILSSLEMEIKTIFGNNYIIELAENGDDAISLCTELLAESIEIALVISDYIMPKMTGDILLTHIHKLSPKTVKIMLTGQADIDAISRAIRYANLYRYISKPWQIDDLKLTVKEAVNSYLLEHKISEHTDKLEETNISLIKLNQDKNEFLGIAAHDLKNPLSAIKGWAEMIVEDYDDMPKSEVIEISNLILNSSRQMFELIRNLLDVNAIESGNINTKLNQVDILPTVQEIVNHYSERAKIKNIILQFHKKNNKYDAFVDKNTVYQILDNLISNAVKYSPYGKHIDICMRKSEKMVCCEIKDEGQGLSELDQKRLFNKFTRLTPKPTGHEHSNGLGLFIVKKLVEAMNGNVWCKSELGKGTSFFVEFPLFNSRMM
ncbi:MAG: hybrid sensor histidine kinase/response regulator [Candidatus Marithrix sp.]